MNKLCRRPIAAYAACSVVCIYGLSVCWSHGCAAQKRVNRSRCRLGLKEPCRRWDQDRTNPFAAAKGDKSAMRPIYFGHMLLLILGRS